MHMRWDYFYGNGAPNRMLDGVKFLPSWVSFYTVFVKSCDRAERLGPSHDLTLWSGVIGEGLLPVILFIYIESPIYVISMS